VPEPFLSSLRGAGNPVATYSSKDSVPGHPTQLFFTSGALVKSDPKLVKDMTAAVDETLEYAQANPDDVKAHVATFLKVPADVLSKVQLEEFGTDLRRAQIEQMAKLMTKDGLVKKAPDVAGLLPKQ
jgi:NitT/TauT family transport system substrate-binding protein